MTRPAGTRPAVGPPAVPRLRLRRDSVEWRTLEGRIIAVDLRTHQVLETNRTGALIWNALIDGGTREQLLETVGAAYGLPEDRAAADVDAFLGMLRDTGLLDEGVSTATASRPAGRGPGSS